MTVLDDKIILFPSEKEFKIEFLIDEEVSMRGSDKNIQWTIDHNFGTQSSKQEHENKRNNMFAIV